MKRGFNSLPLPKDIHAYCAQINKIFGDIKMKECILVNTPKKDYKMVTRVRPSI